MQTSSVAAGASGGVHFEPSDQSPSTAVDQFLVQDGVVVDAALATDRTAPSRVTIPRARASEASPRGRSPYRRRRRGNSASAIIAPSPLALCPSAWPTS